MHRWSWCCSADGLFSMLLWWLFHIIRSHGQHIDDLSICRHHKKVPNLSWSKWIGYIVLPKWTGEPLFLFLNSWLLENAAMYATNCYRANGSQESQTLITHLSTLDVAPMTYLLAGIPFPGSFVWKVCFLVRCQRFLDFLVFRPEDLRIWIWYTIISLHNVSIYILKWLYFTKHQISWDFRSFWHRSPRWPSNTPRPPPLGTPGSVLQGPLPSAARFWS